MFVAQKQSVNTFAEMKVTSLHRSGYEFISGNDQHYWLLATKTTT